MSSRQDDREASINVKNSTESTHISIETIEQEVEQLPMLPGVLHEIMKHDEEDVGFYDRIFDLARSDPPLAMMILSFANSAASSPAQPISDLKMALVRSGSHTIKSLLTTLSVSKVFMPRTTEHKLLWKHSIEVAHFAAFISQSSPDQAFSVDKAYMSGLLHDIGRFVLFQLAPKALDDTDAKGWATPTELVTVEERLLGFDHAKVGYIACKKLDMPPLVASVVRYHHYLNVVKHPQAPEKFKKLCVYVQLADAVSVMLTKNPEWREWEPEVLLEVLHNKCVLKQWKDQVLPIQELAKQLPGLTDKVNAMFETLGI